MRAKIILAQPFNSHHFKWELRLQVFYAKHVAEIASHQIDIEQISPQEGWMEQDPKEILFAVKACIKEVIRKFDVLGMKIDEIVTVGITNQRETTIAWDANTGDPLHNAIGKSSPISADVYCNLLG